jgi:hypothetical protein
MTPTEILGIRLHHQQLSATSFTKPEEVVQWMGAMQAQEYAMSKWAIGLRLKGVTDAQVERAFNEGTILRTHLLRPTWHFVSPADIRWLLGLTAPRVHAASSYMYRTLEMDAKLFNRAHAVLEKELEGGKHLTRKALHAALKKKKVNADGLRLGYMMMHAELEQLICSGHRQGKQFTYALLDERVSPVKAINREEALARLAHRYFTSRGPATVHDFAYWSGLTVKDAMAGSATLGSNFVREVMDGQEYIFIAPTKNKTKLDSTFLMPDYDEYGMSYKNRSALSPIQKLNSPKASIVFNRMVVINGRIEGTWQRTLSKNTVDVRIVPFAPFSKVHEQAVEKAIGRFQSFLTTKPEKNRRRKSSSTP